MNFVNLTVDEVSENEKFSSVSSDSTVTSSDSSISFEKPVSDWCRTLSFNSNDIKQYMNWLESRGLYFILLNLNCFLKFIKN